MMRLLSTSHISGGVLLSLLLAMAGPGSAAKGATTEEAATLLREGLPEVAIVKLREALEVRS